MGTAENGGRDADLPEPKSMKTRVNRHEFVSARPWKSAFGRSDADASLLAIQAGQKLTWPDFANFVKLPRSAVAIGARKSSQEVTHDGGELSP